GAGSGTIDRRTAQMAPKRRRAGNMANGSRESRQERRLASTGLHRWPGMPILVAPQRPPRKAAAPYRMGNRAALHLSPPREVAQYRRPAASPNRPQSPGHAERPELRAHGHGAGGRRADRDGGRDRPPHFHNRRTRRDGARWGPDRGLGERPRAHSGRRALRHAYAGRDE